MVVWRIPAESWFEVLTLLVGIPELVMIKSGRLLQITAELMDKQVVKSAPQIGRDGHAIFAGVGYIAYIRFACVYRRFKDVDELMMWYQVTKNGFRGRRKMALKKRYEKLKLRLLELSVRWSIWSESDRRCEIYRI